jgi:P27 family predicted phage terminase small subunit
MGKPGPKPKPTALKQLEGNPGKRALPANEPKPEGLAEIPKPPTFLLPLAKKHWKKMAEELRGCGLLTSIDLDAFAIMCNSYATWVDAQQQLKKTGMLVKSPNGYPVISPYVSIAEKALNRVLQYQKEFGLTPSSRVRVETDGEGEEDEFSKFLEDTRSDG